MIGTRGCATVLHAVHMHVTLLLLTGELDGRPGNRHVEGGDGARSGAGGNERLRLRCQNSSTHLRYADTNSKVTQIYRQSSRHTLRSQKSHR